MAKKIKKWYMEHTHYDDVIVLSKVSLSRNLAGYPFVSMLTADKAREVVDAVRALAPDLAGRLGMEYYSCAVNKLNDIEKSVLVESHSATKGLMDEKCPSGLVISEDESISLMINDEDHILIQSIAAGNDMRTAFANANRIDDYIDRELHYAYSDKYGYLTGSMTLAGTGLKASYMLSLPAVTVSGKLPALQDEVSRYGILIRGIYGEGSKSPGFMYQVVNQKTMGCTENDILENLDQITNQITALEHRQRDEWYEKERDQLEDKVYRSYGILKYLKSVSAQDAMTLLAQVKLGSDLGILQLDGNGSDIHRMMIEIQPGNIAKTFGPKLGEKTEERVRAEFINEALPKLMKDKGE